MSGAEVSYEKRGQLGLIRLERPEALNALTHPMIAGVQEMAEAAERDPEIVAICITGQGRGFCAGIDVSILSDHARNGQPPRAAPRPGKPPRPALFSFLLDISKPVIAAINGPAAGGGFVLAMMSDLRFMAEDAYVTTVFARRGLVAEHGTSWLLPRIVGLSRALDLMWSSRKVGADEAYRIGLADRVVAGDRLIAEVEAYVADMASAVAPRAIASVKRQVLADLQASFDEAAHRADELMAASLKHPDATEGAASFIERRPPRFAAWTGE